MAISKSSVDLAIDPLLTCKLCLTECSLADMYQLYTCKCLFCKTCMKEYLKIMIIEGNILNIGCPDADCHIQGNVTASEIKNLVDETLYSRYTRLKFEREVELDPNRTFCPEVGCETICHVCSASRAEITKVQPVLCPKCELLFCSVCKATWHAEKSCDEFRKTDRKEDEGIPFSAAEEDAQIKRCPMCHIPIERNDGCAQMMCKRCKHVFCWYCLKSLDDDFLLRHYDKGPCKDKLGHSRASVIWHRTQVIGIFAGFGVLLLVASPFLLLAAPCILCCKCKLCKCCEDDDPDGMPV